MLVVKAHHTREAIQSLANKERSAPVAMRLRAVALAMQELSCAQIGAVLGRAPDYALRWVRAYNQGGLAALRGKPRKGRTRAMSPKQEQALRAFVEARAQDPSSPRRISGREVREHINTVLGVPLSLPAAYRVLHRLGLKPAKPHSTRRKADAVAGKAKAPVASKKRGKPSAAKPGATTGRSSAKKARAGR